MHFLFSFFPFFRQTALETDIAILENEIHEQYTLVFRFTEFADATRRQIDVLQRAKNAAEEREVFAAEMHEYVLCMNVYSTCV